MSPKFRPHVCAAIAVAAASCATAAVAGAPAAPPAAATSPPAAASSVPAAGLARPSDAEKLQEVTVKGKRDLLEESDARMKKLKASLPDMNSDTGHQESLAQRIYDRASDYLSSHRDINALSPESKQQMLHIKDQVGVDGARDANKPPVPQPNAKDYVDPFCQAGSCPP